MGNTTSLAITPTVTGEVKPSSTTPQASIETVITPNGGIAVTKVNEPVVTPSTEGLILGKFKTQADLEAAYKALEAGVGKPKVDGETPPVTTPASLDLSIADAAKALTDKGLDYKKFALEYAKNGALSSESYAELFGKQITAQQIDAFITNQAPLIAAQKAAAEASTKEILEHAGGLDEFKKLQEYASKAISPEELASYGRAIENGDKVAAKLLLSSFKAQMDKSLGKEPNLNGGTPPASGSQDVYQTLGQYHSDLADPKYGRDEYYRRKVDAKIERSTKLYAPA